MHWGNVTGSMGSDGISKAMQGQKLLCLTLVIRCLYGTVMIRDPQRVHLISDVISHLGFLHGVFKAVANTYRNSKWALTTWNAHGHNVLFRKLHRSCSPLKMSVGRMCITLTTPWCFPCDHLFWIGQSIWHWRAPFCSLSRLNFKQYEEKQCRLGSWVNMCNNNVII